MESFKYVVIKELLLNKPPCSCKTYITQDDPKVPHPATASTLNAVLMRNSELREGIVVVDERGEEVGTSVVAANRAVRETAITRAFLPAPILLIPPVIMAGLEK